MPFMPCLFSCLRHHPVPHAQHKREGNSGMGKASMCRSGVNTTAALTQVWYRLLAGQHPAHPSSPYLTSSESDSDNLSPPPTCGYPAPVGVLVGGLGLGQSEGR